MILTLRLTESNQWVRVDHATRINLLNSPPMTGSVDDDKDDISNNDKRKMILDMYEQCECKM